MVFFFLGLFILGKKEKVCEIGKGLFFLFKSNVYIFRMLNFMSIIDYVSLVDSLWLNSSYF